MGTFETFLGAKLERLRGYAQLLTGDRRDAHDLSQDAPDEHSLRQVVATGAAARLRGRRLIAVVAGVAAAVLVAGGITLAHSSDSSGPMTGPIAGHSRPVLATHT